MTKNEVKELLEKYKDRPVVIGLSDEGQALYGNIDGHWLFAKDDCLVQVRVNSGAEGIYGISNFNQQQGPFIIKHTSYDLINYVRTIFGKEADDISQTLSGLEPVGTTKSFSEIIKEIEGNSIRKASSARGVVCTDNVAPGSTYGRFTGSAISTERGGVPKYMEMELN